MSKRKKRSKTSKLMQARKERDLAKKRLGLAVKRRIKTGQLVKRGEDINLIFGVDRAESKLGDATSKLKRERRLSGAKKRKKK
jgi:hypothetical protein